MSLVGLCTVIFLMAARIHRNIGDIMASYTRYVKPVADWLSKT